MPPGSSCILEIPFIKKNVEHLLNDSGKETLSANTFFEKFGKYVIIEKGTHVLTTAVKTNITIYHFHRSFRLRRLLEELLSIF